MNKDTHVSFTIIEVVGASYVEASKSIQLQHNVHSPNGGIVGSADVMLSIAETETLIEQLQKTLKKAKAKRLEQAVAVVA